jgi:hypothetical protein
MANEAALIQKSTLLDKISIGPHHRMSIFLIVIGMLTILPAVQGYNDGARMATIQSIVENHTLSIDHSVFSDGHDKVYINGKFYAHQPVLTAVLGAVIYYPLYHLGIELDYGWNLAYYLITLLTVKLFWYLGLKAFYAVLESLGVKEKEGLLLTLALGLGSLYFSWSSTFTNHVISASSLMIGFYFLQRAKTEANAFWSLFLAGLFISLGGSLDLAILVFYAGFGVYVLFQRYSFKSTLGYILPLVLTVFPTFLTYDLISGSFLPFSVVRDYFIYPDSPWQNNHLLTGVQVKSGWYLVRYSFQALIGKKGFLLHNPMSLLALPLLGEEIWKRGKLKKEALVISICSVVVIGYYLLASQDYSGFAYSIRWFVPLLPLWFVFLYRGFLVERPRFRKLFPPVFLASVIVASVGLIDPWTTIVTGIPFLDNLITLMLGI